MSAAAAATEAVHGTTPDIVIDVHGLTKSFGGRVVVRDLFFATPARRKFLKHPRTEAEHAEAADCEAGVLALAAVLEELASQ